MATISLSMLRDTVTLYTVESMTRDRVTIWSGAYTLKRVYIEGGHAWSNGSDGKESADAFDLYIEPALCIATHEAEGETVRGLPEIKLGQKVVFGGLDLYIKAIEPPTAEKSFYKVVMV